ncbi:hypothetical protein ID0397_06180 [Helicobacter pylori]
MLALPLIEKRPFLNHERIKLHSFSQIKAYFDTLNFDTSHFVNSNDICTPLDCVKEMIDTIPSDFFKQEHLKILDCCCGNGNFFAYLETKTSLNNLYFNEINPKRIEHVKEYFGSNIHLSCKDFLTFDKTMLYDLIVANPPFAKFNALGRTSKNHNLARDFIKKALELTKNGGYILFIVPNHWMSFSDRNILPNLLSQYQFIHLNIGGAKKYFKKVGSSFTWFLLQKVPNQKSFSIENHYVLKDKQKVSLKTHLNFIPLYLNELVCSILDKTINNAHLPTYKIETTSFLHRTTKKEFLSPIQNKDHPYKLIHTPSQVIYSKIPHKYQKGYKVFLSLTNQYSTFIDNCGMTQSIAFVRCQSYEEALKIKSELDNEIYLFLNNLTRYGNFNNIRVLQHLPLLESIVLNKQELEFIQKFNGAYYGKKKERYNFKEC